MIIRAFEIWAIVKWNVLSLWVHRECATRSCMIGFTHLLYGMEYDKLGIMMTAMYVPNDRGEGAWAKQHTLGAKPDVGLVRWLEIAYIMRKISPCNPKNPVKST